MSDYQFNPNVEQWKDILGFPGYEVSDHGRVRSFWRHVRIKGKQGIECIVDQFPQRVLKGGISNGYPSVTMTKGGKICGKKIHRLVLEAFVGPCPQGCESCHNDGIRTHNYSSNLRWDTCKRNNCDKVRHGTNNAGSKNSRSKITEDHVRQIRHLHKQGCMQKDIAVMFNLTRASICLIVNRINWKNIP